MGLAGSAEWTGNKSSVSPTSLPGPGNRSLVSRLVSLRFAALSECLKQDHFHSCVAYKQALFHMKASQDGADFELTATLNYFV